MLAQLFAMLGRRRKPLEQKENTQQEHPYELKQQRQPLQQNQFTRPRQQEWLQQKQPGESAATPAHEQVGAPQWTTRDGYDVASLDGIGNTTPVLKSQDAGHTKDESSPPAQIRKVFVGGIPQDLNADDLYKIFSEFAAVKKAWLQRHRAKAVDASPPRHHRGFGFVIFHDESVVEQLLGPNVSRFHVLADGRKLEIKRAVSSQDQRVVDRRVIPAGTTQSSQQIQAPPALEWTGLGHSQQQASYRWPNESNYVCQMTAVSVPVSPIPTLLPSPSYYAGGLATGPPWPSNSSAVPCAMPLANVCSLVPELYVTGMASSHQRCWPRAMEFQGWAAGAPEVYSSAACAVLPQLPEDLRSSSTLALVGQSPPNLGGWRWDHQCLVRGPSSFR